MSVYRAIFGWALLLTVTADNSVHILSNFSGQFVTSSTLNWLPRAHYDSSKEFVIGAFELVKTTEDDAFGESTEKIKEIPIFVCRALHNGIWVSGRQKEGEKRCVVFLHGSVHAYDRYDLLENVNNAARLSWVLWDRYHQPLVGSVTTDKMYVARHKVLNKEKDSDNTALGYTHYIGTLNSDDMFGTITYAKENGEGDSARYGEILVETEPIYYELTSVKLNHAKQRAIKRVPQVIGEATLANPGSVPIEVARAFGYRYNYSMYWGQGHAILKGLNTSITLINSTTLPDIYWGLEETESHVGEITVKVFLEPETAVNVTVTANYTEMEVPYSGKLVSHYQDKTDKSRTISGIRRELNMMDQKVDYSPRYFLSNNSLVPTTVPPPSTETTSPVPSFDKTNEIGRSGDENSNYDENMIVRPKQSETTIMQSDDGGPLSLTNNAGGNKSAADRSTIMHSLTLVAALIVSFNKIT